MIRILLVFAALMLNAGPSLVGQSFVVTGTVRDAVTREPLAAATIRIAGTPRGTITNAAGEFLLSLDSDSALLRISYVGYRTDSAAVASPQPEPLTILLHPVPIRMAEVVVTGEDPAMGIMRKVIAGKKRWTEGLQSYRFDAFTRQVIRRDTAIAQITESYTTGYWQAGDTLREVIRQRRQTENVPVDRNFASVGGIVNMYDDDIKLAGYTFVGPTSVEAFDYYDFRLEGTRLRDDREVFLIKLEPRSRSTPLFRGTIGVIDDDYALVDVSVTPNEAVVFPLVRSLDLRYAQQFQKFESRYWLPIDIRILAQLEIGIPGLKFPRIGIEASSSMYEYRVNLPLPDSVAKQPRRLVLKEADQLDSLFWSEHQVLPLTSEERTAYSTLDSSQTLQKQFTPGGPLSNVDAIQGGLLGYLDPRFNRVEGWYLGLQHEHDSLIGPVNVIWNVGYGVADRRWKGGVTLEVPIDSENRFFATGSVFDDINTSPQELFQFPLSGMLAALFSKRDYWDYHYARGWSVGMRTRPDHAWHAELHYRRTQESAARKNTDFSILYRSEIFRPNPIAEEGTFSSIVAHLCLGRHSPIPGILLSDFVELDMERGGTEFGGDFDFKRLLVQAEWHPPTFLRRSLTPARFSFRVDVGAGWNVPIQRLVALESALSGYGPYGTFRVVEPREFVGDRSIALFVEHNFRAMPFYWLNIPALYRSSIDFVIFANGGKTWWTSDTYRSLYPDQPDWYIEVGAGLGRILGFLRVDVTRRFTPPSGLAVTASLTSPL